MAGTVDVFTSAEWAKVSTFGPLAPPDADPTNRYADNDAAAAFGQRLFFEKSYSGALIVGDDGSNGGLGAVGEAGKVGCVSCHDPNNWFIDTRSKPGNISLGVNYTPHNAPSLVNASYYKWMTWTGKADAPWCQAAAAPEAPTDAGSDRLTYVHMIYRKYKSDYNAVFPVALDAALDPAAADATRFPASGAPKANASSPDGPWELMTAADRQVVETIMSNCGKSLEAYERKLTSRNAPIDRYIAGDYTALSDSAKRGLELFIGKAACVACHSGPTFTDQDFHVTGVPQIGAHVMPTDNGRFDAIAKVLSSPYNGAGAFSDDTTAGMMKLAGLTQTMDDLGKFRTKSLRHVAKTGPFFHNGSAATLDDVVTFYNMGGGSGMFTGTKDARLAPLNLTTDEHNDLVQFLATALLGEEVPSALMVDTSAP
jgi:cytochrome c peroxidase